MKSARSQEGQAIVWMAIMLGVVVGMAALASDGARGYALRGDLQAAVDAAALAAGDNLQQTGSYTSAEQAATSMFGANMRLYTGPSCTPGYGSPGSPPPTLTPPNPHRPLPPPVGAGPGPAGPPLTHPPP